MTELKVFTNGTDTYVANSAEDCLQIWKEQIGDDYVSDGYGEANDWYEEKPDDYFTIFFEDREEKDFPRDGSFEVVETHPKGWYIKMKAKNKDWVVWNGRGFLASTEF